MPHREIVSVTRALARTQRRAPTRAEDILWRALRARRFDGHKFRRQMPLGPYVADFVCLEARLIVELDGAPHDDDPAQQAHDARRTAWLASQGFRVLRFSNELLLGGSGDLVLDAIRQAVDPSSDLR
jgi:very-short-patch-repair endonuclease